MIESKEFHDWLKHNTNDCERVITDNVSRMKRADNIYKWSGEDTYLYYLEKEKSFTELTVSVRSQVRKAVKLYMAYKEDIGMLNE